MILYFNDYKLIYIITMMGKIVAYLRFEYMAGMVRAIVDIQNLEFNF